MPPIAWPFKHISSSELQITTCSCGSAKSMSLFEYPTYLLIHLLQLLSPWKPMRLASLLLQGLYKGPFTRKALPLRSHSFLHPHSLPLPPFCSSARSIIGWAAESLVCLTLFSSSAQNVSCKSRDLLLLTAMSYYLQQCLARSSTQYTFWINKWWMWYSPKQIVYTENSTLSKGHKT